MKHPNSFKTRIRPRIMSLAWSVGSSFLSAVLISAPILAAMPVSVSAATPDYQALVISQPTVAVAAGQYKNVTLQFKNIGAKSWTGSAAKTALYLNGSSSIFGNSTWRKNDLPALIDQAVVKPGQSATATFTVKAPPQSGTYHEKFLLSYGSNLWIKGSSIDVTFIVSGSAVSAKPAPTTVVTTQTPSTATTPTASGNSDQWKADLVDQGGIEWQVEPGGHLQATVAFKNRGTHAWVTEGGTPVELLTSSKRTSAFKDFSWANDIDVTMLQEKIVQPGSIGHFIVQLRAPAVPGKYSESFQLSAGGAGENWISGGMVTFPILVTTPNEYIAKGIPNAPDQTTLTPTQRGNYIATLLLKPRTPPDLLGDGRVQLTYGFKNTGTATWNSMSLHVAGVEPALSGKLGSVRDDSWVSGSEVVHANSVTTPGQIGFITFTIKAPPRKGSYTAHFSLYADNQNVQDGGIDIPITVTTDGYIAPEPTPPSNPTPTVPATPTTPSNGVFVQPLGGDTSALPNEPIVRIGLFATKDDQMVLRGVNGGFLLTQNGSTVCTLNSGESVTVTYDRANKVYKASGPRCTTQSSTWYVAVAPDGISPIEMTDYSRPVSWLPGANDNKFRGKLELHFAVATNEVWVINELPMEWYLKGIGETSNSSPAEYQKALLTAARTYALYLYEHNTKHAAENYTVDATYDQVYRGYGAEIRDPAVISAVDATRGQIVTYNGKLAITPYYSRSDGRTRSWNEVWGGNSYPWLVSVTVPWDNGKTLWGHGVGMSATGALGAAADGWVYDRILKYFYTNTALMQAYK